MVDGSEWVTVGADIKGDIHSDAPTDHGLPVIGWGIIHRAYIDTTIKDSSGGRLRVSNCHVTCDIAATRLNSLWHC